MAINRRDFLTASSALLATAAVPAGALAAPASAGQPSRYPIDAWQVVDDRFKSLMLANTPLERQWSGALWAEGPAWNAIGRYAVFSDIPRARQMAWSEASGEVFELRNPVGYSNGNAFDSQGRLVACEHSPARVIRYEHDGSTTVLAERYDGKRLNAPNDLVALPSGGIVFTDPGYGAYFDYEGEERDLELETGVYYIDDTRDEPVLLTKAPYMPNGIGLMPDGKTLIVNDSAPTHYPDQPSTITRWTLDSDQPSLSDKKQLHASHEALYDGLAIDRDGHIWAATSGGEDVDGVSVFDADGTLLGRILLPEKCGNVCFTGEKHNRLLMAASQSIYTIYTNTIGV